MTWFTSDYQNIYSLVAGGNTLTPGVLVSAASSAAGVGNAQSLLNSVSGTVTGATETALTNAFSGATSGLNNLSQHVNSQVSNFTRYTSAARQATFVAQSIVPTVDACLDTNGAFGAILGVAQSALDDVDNAVAQVTGLIQDVIDAVNSGIQAAIDAAVAALDAAAGAIISAIGGAITSIGLQIAEELAYLASFIDVSLNLGDTMGMAQAFLNNPCARAIINSSGSPELIAALEALE